MIGLDDQALPSPSIPYGERGHADEAFRSSAVRKSKTIKAYSAGFYTPLFLRDVDPIGGAGFIKYIFVLVLCNRETSRPTFFVTLETSPEYQMCFASFNRMAPG